MTRDPRARSGSCGPPRRGMPRPGMPRRGPGPARRTWARGRWSGYRSWGRSRRASRSLPRGRARTGAGIFSGDWVVVRQQFDPPRDGDIVAAALDGIEVEGTVKTYKKAGGRTWLMPHNPAYMPIAGDRAEIRGKVVAVLRWLP